MSIRVMSMIWDSPIKPPSLKLAALALADWCNDDGGSLHPSMSAIAKKVGVSRCQAQRLVQTMKAAGVLSVVGNAFGGAPGETPRYVFNVERAATWTGSTDATGSANDTGSTHAQRRVAPMHKTGSAHATQTTIEPSIEPPAARKPRKVAELECPHDAIRALYAEVLPDFPVIKAWGASRQKACRARWADMVKAKGWATQADGLSWFRLFFETAWASDFLSGRAPRSGNHQNWTCDIDFLLSDKGFTGVIEGKYTNRTKEAA